MQTKRHGPACETLSPLDIFMPQFLTLFCFGYTYQNFERVSCSHDRSRFLDLDLDLRWIHINRKLPAIVRFKIGLHTKAVDPLLTGYWRIFFTDKRN